MSLSMDGVFRTTGVRSIWLVKARTEYATENAVSSKQPCWCMTYNLVNLREKKLWYIFVVSCSNNWSGK